MYLFFEHELEALHRTLGTDAVPLDGPVPHQHTVLEAQTRNWRPAWAFAGAFVALVAAIGIAVAITGGDRREVVDQPAPTTTVVPPTSVTEPTAPVPVPPATATAPRIIPTDITWEMVMPAGSEGLQFWKLLSDGSRVVAIGGTYTENGFPVWSSDDGFEWQPFSDGGYLLNGTPLAGPDGFTSLTVEDTSVEYGLHWMSDAVWGPGMDRRRSLGAGRAYLDLAGRCLVAKCR